MKNPPPPAIPWTKKSKCRRDSYQSRAHDPGDASENAKKLPWETTQTAKRPGKPTGEKRDLYYVGIDGRETQLHPKNSHQ